MVTLNAKGNLGELNGIIDSFNYEAVIADLEKMLVNM